ncbi:hypothetical protein K9L67_04795 [Candidatus Woesearchaeota archaeon]|nr:hypothetical protein [Candidatus Woesearchaeota archaeon]MCF7901518.1 hypothetical protein [Candidatus Woesearchaeota archaeon]MCF8013931.1 hypothetical protein [Candidatus Woesearchaeota archaeon]
MYNFDVAIYSDDPINICDSLESLSQDINEIGKQLEKRSLKDKQIEKIIINLDYARFWGVWNELDGKLGDHEDKLFQKQKTTLKKFSKNELEKILNITLNTANLVPITKKDIKHYIGNTIIYNEIFLKPMSIFKSILSEESEKILINAMFWENLGIMEIEKKTNQYYNSIEIVKKCLNEYEHLLTPDYASKGISILHRIMGKRTIDNKKMSESNILYEEPQIEIDEFEEIHKINYYNFIKELYSAKEEQGLDVNDIGKLLIPYTSEKIYEIEDSEENMYTIQNNPISKDKFIRKIIDESEELRKDIAWHLRMELIEGQINGPIMKEINKLPKKTDIIYWALEHIKTNQEPFSDFFFEDQELQQWIYYPKPDILKPKHMN